MKRSDIVRSIQVQFKRMPATDASDILDFIAENLIKHVADGDRIEIRSFGNFQPRVRAAKTVINPSSLEMMTVGAGRAVLFRPSRELTKKMNG